MQKLPQQHQDCFYISTSLKAPLATFDTIDLDDEDVLPLTVVPILLSTPIKAASEGAQVSQLSTNRTKIGGAQSKGRGGASKAGTDPHCQQPGFDHLSKEGHDSQQPASDQDDENAFGDAPTPTNQSPTHDVEDLSSQPAFPDVEGVELETAGETSCDPPVKEESEVGAGETSVPPPVPHIGKIQGTWLKHQDSDSSSSSGSCSDTFTFRPIKGSASASATQDDDDDDETDYTPQTRRRLLLREKSNDYSLNLYPEDLDPTQIASPSKRKAFTKRLQRLQVKTSPIVRPRSTTPINVVTLDEYVACSPDTPISPFQEKLKISLPSAEFVSKPKSPRSSWKQSETPSETSSFVFNEEILFSHTRSALVVDKVGNVPPSPRRVLIPPTLSPSSSPKLGRAAVNLDENSTQLVYFKGEKEDEIFGQPAEQGNSDWANFSDFEEAVHVGAESSEENHHVPLSSSESAEEGEAEEFLTVNIHSDGPSKPANIQVILSAASSSTPSPSTPDSDEAIKAATSATSQTEAVIPQQETAPAPTDEITESAPCPPPIPPRRRPPPPPPPPPTSPPPPPPSDEDRSEIFAANCDLLVDISSQ